jgi:zinc protease
MGPSLALLFGLTSGAAHADSIPKASYKLNLPQYDLPMVQYQFPSGMRMVFQEDHNQPLVAVTLIIDQGSDGDPPGYEGMAHVIEHLNFRARHGDLPSNMEVVKQLGAGFNATTFLDWTNYLTVAPKDSLISLLQLEAVRLISPVENVTDAEIKTEIEVVRNELRQGLETLPGASAAFEVLLSKLYPPEHPYGHTTIGTHESLSNIDMKAVKAFTDKWYRPEHATLAVVGDFSLADTQNIINEAFGPYPELLVDPKDPKAPLKMVDIPPRVDCANVPEPPEPRDLTTSTVEGIVDTETATVAWSLPGGYCGIDPVGRMSAYLLSVWIQQTLVPTWEYDAGADIPGVACSFIQFEESSLLICDVEAKAGYSGDRLIEKIGDALYLQWDKQFAAAYPKRFDSMMNSSRMDAMAYFLKSVDNTADIFAGRATITANHLHFTGSATYFSDTMNEWNKLDQAAVEALATKYITRDRMVKVIVEPMDEEERARREATAKNSENSESKTYAAAQRDDEYNMAFDLKTLTNEAIERTVMPPDVSKITSYTLDNGLKVNIMPYGKAPLVRVGLLLNGGTRTGAQFGLDLAASELVQRGTTQAERVLAVAGSYDEARQDNAQVLYADGSSGNIDALLHTIRFHVDDFDWRWAELSELVKARRAALLRSADKGEWWTDRIGQAALFPDHPLGEFVRPTTWKTVKDWPQSTVEDWVHQKYQPNNSELFVVGMIESLDDVKDAVAKYLGTWENEGTTPLPITYPPVTKIPDARAIIVSSPKVTQTDVTAMCQLPTWTKDDYAAGQVLGDMLSERLWTILRVQSGVTYGAGAGVISYPGGARTLYMNSLVQNNATGLAIDTFKRVLADAQAAKWDEGALATVKWSRARRYPIGETSTTQMLDRLMSVRYSIGLDNEFFKWYPHELATVSIADLTPVLGSCAEHLVITLQGPTDYAEPALKERNIAYEVLDWETLLRAEMTPKEVKKRDKAKAKKEAEDAKKAATAPAVADAR